MCVWPHAVSRTLHSVIYAAWVTYIPLPSHPWCVCGSLSTSSAHFRCDPCCVWFHSNIRTPCLCHPGCVPYSNSHIPSIFSFAHAVCMTPSNHSLFHPCCLYGPIQPAVPLLHAIQAVCSPFSCPCPFSLISMLCAWSPFSQLYPIPSVTHMRVPIQPAIHIRTVIIVVCMVPFQPAISRFKIQDSFIASHQTYYDIQHRHISINYKYQYKYSNKLSWEQRELEILWDLWAPCLFHI